MPGTNSPLFTGPLTISRTTTLRAAVLDPASVRQNVTTVTWLFLEDILQQGATPPPGWPANRQVNNHVMEYGLRPEIVTGDAARLRNGMTNAIPSISLVTDLANLFNAQRGIYVNPGNDGIAWERPVSVELIDPVNGSGSEFHIDAGLRIRGAYSRSSEQPQACVSPVLPLGLWRGQTALPAVWRRRSVGVRQGGPAHLAELFLGVREQQQGDVRAGNLLARFPARHGHALHAQPLLPSLSQRPVLGPVPNPGARRRRYRRNLSRRRRTTTGTASRPASRDIPPPPATAISPPFTRLHNLAINQGFTGAYTNNYLRVKGLNPDGTPNPAYPVYLDEDNLIIYMLIAYYTGDPDSPVSIWGGMPNNMYGLSIA